MTRVPFSALCVCGLAMPLAAQSPDPAPATDDPVAWLHRQPFAAAEFRTGWLATLIREETGIDLAAKFEEAPGAAAVVQALGANPFAPDADVRVALGWASFAALSELVDRQYPPQPLDLVGAAALPPGPAVERVAALVAATPDWKKFELAGVPFPCFAGPQTGAAVGMPRPHVVAALGCRRRSAPAEAVRGVDAYRPAGRELVERTRGLAPDDALATLWIDRAKLPADAAAKLAALAARTPDFAPLLAADLVGASFHARGAAGRKVRLFARYAQAAQAEAARRHAAPAFAFAGLPEAFRAAAARAEFAVAPLPAGAALLHGELVLDAAALKATAAALAQWRQFLAPPKSPHDDLLRQDPQSLPALYARGTAWRKRKEFARALADFDEALRANPKYGYALIGRGQTHGDAGNLDLAIADYTALLALGPDPNRAHAFRNRASAWQDKGAHDRAIADYTAALEVDPEFVDALNGRGMARARKGEHALAVADYTAALRLDPKHEYAYYNRGLAHWRTGRDDDAIADYTAALRVNPKFAQAAQNRAAVWVRKGDHRQAVADYTLVMALAPKDVGNLVRRAESHRLLKDHDAAVLDCTAALKLDPQSAWAHTIRGMAWASRGHRENALSDFGAALRCDPRYVWALYQRAELRRAAKEWDLALADFSESVRIAPLNAYGHNGRGNVRLARKEYDAAYADYSAAILLGPAEPVHHSNRATIHVKRGDYAKATADFREAVRRGPKNGWALNGLAWHLATCPVPAQRNGAEAVKYARDAVALDANWSWRDTLAAALAEAGDFAAAVKEQEQALADPLCVGADRAGLEARLKLYRAGKPHHEP